MTTAATVPAVYASALLDLASERDQRDAVVAECAAVRAAVEGAPELLDALTSPSLGRERAGELVRSCFAEQAGKLVVDFLQLLVERDRIEDLQAILAEVQRLADEQAGRVSYQVTAAVELDESDRQRVAEGIRRVAGANADIAFQVDADLIGGLRIQGPDRVADFTVSRHLRDMKRLMLEAPVAATWHEEEGESA